jgi:hypothetical protein
MSKSSLNAFEDKEMRLQNARAWLFFAAFGLALGGCGGSDDTTPNLDGGGGDAIAEGGGESASDTPGPEDEGGSPDAEAPDTGSDGGDDADASGEGGADAIDLPDSATEGGDADAGADADPGDATPPDPDASADTDGGDSDGGEEGGLPDPTELDPEPLPQSVYDCDAGHEQWVRRVLPVLYGRPAAGTHEIRLWTQATELQGRAAALDAMMESPEYVERWREALMDALFVSRLGDKSLAGCFAAPLRPADGGELAAFVRDHGPMEVGIGAFNMNDLLRSAIRLDDLSPVYRAQLFAMMPRPVTGANVSLEGMDMARRLDFFEVFQQVWLQRDMDCIGCHNGTWSITGDPDPALDRTWEVPGFFEKALFGAPEGRPTVDVASMFRHHLVVQAGPASRRPWGWDAVCGQFAREENLTDDVNDEQAYLVEGHGEAGTVWVVERLLRLGYQDLRDNGLDISPTTLEVGGSEALAYLNALATANEVWLEITGYPLTVAHDFPRNRAQRDTLWVLVDNYIAKGFSLRSLVADTVLDPRFNQLPPEAGCGSDDGYYLPPSYNPWTTEEDVPVLQKNGAGDTLVRREATWMFRGAAAAMGWDQIPEFIDGGFLADMWVGIGKQTRDAEPGFRGIDFQGLLLWEGTYGVCAKGSQLTQAGKDYIDAIVELAQTAEAPSTWAEATVGHMVLLLKDRILANPTFIEGEEELLADLVGQNLNAPAKSKNPSALNQGLRRLCGALLESPEFLIEGATPTEALGAAPPPIVHPDHTPQALCAAALELWESTGYAATCTPDGALELAPAPAP